jgi:hypothetical protein
MSKNVCVCARVRGYAAHTPAFFYFCWKCSFARKCVTVFCHLICKSTVSSTLDTHKYVQCFSAGLILEKTPAKGVWDVTCILKINSTNQGAGKTIHCSSHQDIFQKRLMFQNPQQEKGQNCMNFSYMRQRFKSYVWRTSPHWQGSVCVHLQRCFCWIIVDCPGSNWYCSAEGRLLSVKRM